MYFPRFFKHMYVKSVKKRWHEGQVDVSRGVLGRACDLLNGLGGEAEYWEHRQILRRIAIYHISYPNTTAVTLHSAYVKVHTSKWSMYYPDLPLYYYDFHSLGQYNRSSHRALETLNHRPTFPTNIIMLSSSRTSAVCLELLMPNVKIFYTVPSLPDMKCSLAILRLH